MAAWSDYDDAYDRAESYGQHVTDEAFYPECSLEELCASIDAATLDSLRLADELAAITRDALQDAA